MLDVVLGKPAACLVSQTEMVPPNLYAMGGVSPEGLSQSQAPSVLCKLGKPYVSPEAPGFSAHVLFFSLIPSSWKSQTGEGMNDSLTDP